MIVTANETGETQEVTKRIKLHNTNSITSKRNTNMVETNRW